MWLMQVLGHLAAEVAKWLGPLVVGSMVEAAGTVQDEPTTPSSPITINIQVFVWSPRASRPQCRVCLTGSEQLDV